jgi:hypothetical protein
LLDLLQHFAGMSQKRLARGRERNALAVTVKQAGAEMFFEVFDAITGRRKR